jgi:aconitate hydratase
MGLSVARKLLESHLVEDDLVPGREIAIRIDQTLTQDATGTLVMLELEAMGLDRVRTELSAQYVDHNLIQADFRNPDDHLFLRSACRRFGIWYSREDTGGANAMTSITVRAGASVGRGVAAPRSSGVATAPSPTAGYSP